jgi:hypothetical protein
MKLSPELAMKYSWLLALSLLVTPPVLALELTGTWTGNDGQSYVLQQRGKQVLIISPEGRIAAQLSPDDALVQAQQVTFQWIDDDTLVLRNGALGKVTKLRRQL